MPSLTDSLDQLEREAREALAAVQDLEALDAWRLAYLCLLYTSPSPRDS